ncbi:reverse transcriptase domain-containing protein [Tanacetum coccineum]
MTAHHNYWDTSATREETSRNIFSATSTESPEVVRQLELIEEGQTRNSHECKLISSLRLDECLALADLGASINLMPLSIWKQLSLPKLTSTRMTLELADRSSSQDIFLHCRKELTLRVDDEAITFKVGQTSIYSRSYKMVNQVNVIDVACEEYAQKVLGFSDSLSSGNPTPSDPIIAPSFPPSFHILVEEGDFIFEEN